MSLEIDLSLDTDIRSLNTFFDDVKFKAITKAARKGLNRAASRTQSKAIKEIRKRRNLKLKDLKGSKKQGTKGFVKIMQARGSDLFSMESSVVFSGVPLPLILFIVGQATPVKQLVRNARRKSRRFAIKKGVKKPKKGLFVQKAKRGGRRFQVFRRVNPNDPTKGFRKQSAPSVAETLRKKTSMLSKIENSAIAIMQREFDTALRFELGKI